MHRPTRLPAFALLALAAGTALAQAQAVGVASSSPFLPAAGAGPLTGPSDTVEFAGVSSVNNQTMISLYDVATKRGRWINVGGKLDGTEVLSYDANKEQVVVRIYGQLKMLSMRKSSVAGTGSSVAAVAAASSNANANVTSLVAAVDAPATPAPQTAKDRPTTPQAKQEEEARMFVSDMLEIGMQHRKAYEEAQKSAASVGTTSGVAAGTAYTPVLAPASPTPAPAH